MFIENRQAVQKSTTASMAGKVCVVSCSTSGVGLEAVKRLARGNAHIVLVCRNLEKRKTSGKSWRLNMLVPVEIMIADFSDLEDVRKAAAILIRDYPASMC